MKEELNDQVVVAKFATTTQHGEIEEKIQTYMTEYYNLDVKTIGKHIANALKEEVDNSVVAKFATTATDGKNLSRRLLYSGYDYLCNDCRVKTERKRIDDKHYYELFDVEQQI